MSSDALPARMVRKMQSSPVILRGLGEHYGVVSAIGLRVEYNLGCECLVCGTGIPSVCLLRGGYDYHCQNYEGGRTGSDFQAHELNGKVGRCEPLSCETPASYDADWLRGAPICRLDRRDVDRRGQCISRRRNRQHDSGQSMLCRMDYIQGSH